MRSYSLNNYEAKQSCPATLNHSNEVSFEGPSRKFSMADINHRIDIDQVMVDIKLTPLKSNEFNDKIKTLYACLEWMKRLSPTLIEEVRTAELIVQSIEAKWKKQQHETKRQSQPQITAGGYCLLQQEKDHIHSYAKMQGHQQIQESSQKQSSHKRQDSTGSKRKPNHHIASSNIYSDVSPIKQLDEATSRIVYKNFSIKQIESSCKKEFSHKKSTQNVNDRHQQSMCKLTSSKHLQSSKDTKSAAKPINMYKRENSIVPVSVFDADDEEMEKLARNIQALDRVLERKGLGLRNDTGRDNYGNLQKGVSKTALKEVTLNSAKQMVGVSSSKKCLAFGSRQRVSSANKQNLFE